MDRFGVIDYYDDIWLCGLLFELGKKASRLELVIVWNGDDGCSAEYWSCRLRDLVFPLVGLT